MREVAELLLILVGVPAGMAAGLCLVVKLSPSVANGQPSGLVVTGPTEDGWTEEVARGGGVTLARASSFDAVLHEQDRRGAAGEFAQTY